MCIRDRYTPQGPYCSSLFLPVPDTVDPYLFGRLAIFDGSAGGSGELLTFFHDITQNVLGGPRHMGRVHFRDHSSVPQARLMVPVEATDAYVPPDALTEQLMRMQGGLEGLQTAQLLGLDPLKSNVACGIGLKDRGYITPPIILHY